MAISLICGAPGAGKTYNAVRLTLVPALDLGRPIWTNVPLNETAIRAVWPNASLNRFDPADETVWTRVDPGALIVLDEVGAIFPSGQRADKVPKEQLELIAMHRHRVGSVQDDQGELRNLSSEVVLVTQGSGDIAKWVRTKVDRTYLVRKLDAVGLDSKFRVDIYEKWEDTLRPRSSKLMKSYTGSYQSRYGELYQSHTKADFGAAVDVSELKADKGATVWGAVVWRFAAGAGFLLLAGYLASQVSLWPGEASAKPAERIAESGAAPGSSGESAAKKSVSVSVAQSGEAVVSSLSALASPVAEELPWSVRAWVRRESTRTYFVVLSRGVERRRLSGVQCRERYGEVSCFVDGSWIGAYLGDSVRVAGGGDFFQSGAVASAEPGLHGRTFAGDEVSYSGSAVQKKVVLGAAK